jgi:hypothetical protein
MKFQSWFAGYISTHNSGRVIVHLWALITGHEDWNRATAGICREFQRK